VRYFLDTEFIDTGKQIDLVSIAIVAEDGRQIYMQSSEFTQQLASDWVKAHVFPHLALCPQGEHSLAGDLFYHYAYGQCTFTDAKGIAGAQTDCLWRTREQIAREIRVFCDPEQYGRPEFWGWCCGYDWVALCQLFGTMMDLPTGWPHYMRDLQAVLDERGLTDEMLPPQSDQAHNALADARYLELSWEWLTVTGATAPRWVLNEQDYEHLRSGAWLSEEKNPLLLGDKAAQVHLSIDGLEFAPRIVNLAGGYVGHEGLATTGGDGGQELVVNLGDEEAHP
jgi:hypothetical protein